MKSLEQCTFCKKAIEFGTGRTIVLSTGISEPFCSGKCLKNHRLGRNPDETKWVIRTKKVKSNEK